MRYLAVALSLLCVVAGRNACSQTAPSSANQPKAINSSANLKRQIAALTAERDQLRADLEAANTDREMLKSTVDNLVAQLVEHERFSPVTTTGSTGPRTFNTEDEFIAEFNRVAAKEFVPVQIGELGFYTEDEFLNQYNRLFAYMYSHGLLNAAPAAWRRPTFCQTHTVNLALSTDTSTTCY